MMKRKTGFATIGDPIDRSTCRPPAAQTRRPMNDHSIAYMAYGMYQAHKHTNATHCTELSAQAATRKAIAQYLATRMHTRPNIYVIASNSDSIRERADGSCIFLPVSQLSEERGVANEIILYLYSLARLRVGTRIVNVLQERKLQECINCRFRFNNGRRRWYSTSFRSGH